MFKSVHLHLTLKGIITLENRCIGNEAKKSMDVFEAIRTRRSIRKYKTDPVKKRTLFKVLEAVRLAPSAMNRQPYNLIVVTEPKTKEKLSSACNQNWVVPVMIIVCAFPEKSWVREDGEEYWKADAAIVMHSLSLTAVAEGLGTCWIAAFDEDRVKRILGVPSEVRVLAMTPLGCPAEKKGPVTRRKRFEELVRYEKW